MPPSWSAEGTWERVLCLLWHFRQIFGGSIVIIGVSDCGEQKQLPVVVACEDDSADPADFVAEDVVGYYLAAGYDESGPFSSRLGNADDFSWPYLESNRDLPVLKGLAQTQRKAKYTEEVVNRVVRIIEGKEKVRRLEAFDPDEQGHSVPLDLLSKWDPQTEIWLAAYLAFHGAVLSPTMLTSLRKKPPIPETIKKVKKANADALLAAPPNNRAQQQRRRRRQAAPATRGFECALLESP